MIRIVVYAVLAAIGIVLLITTGWVAAVVYVFLVAIAAGIELLLRFAEGRAEAHGGWRFGGDDR